MRSIKTLTYFVTYLCGTIGGKIHPLKLRDPSFHFSEKCLLSHWFKGKLERKGIKP